MKTAVFGTSGKSDAYLFDFDMEQRDGIYKQSADNVKRQRVYSLPLSAY